MQSSPALWAPAITKSRGLFDDQLADKLMAVVGARRTTTKGLSDAVLEGESAVCSWLINCLYRGFSCLPSAPIALPMSTSTYSASKPNGVPLPYGAVVRVLEAAQSLGWCHRKVGFPGIDVPGKVTRLHATGGLFRAFERYGRQWEPSDPPDKAGLILMGGAKGKANRVVVPRTHSAEVAEWQDQLDAINRLLSERCLFLDLPDEVLLAPRASASLPAAHGPGLHLAHYEADHQAIDFAKVALRRIFTRKQLDRGGRLYGGWWQNVSSAHRRHIVIGDRTTAECDYSGMALRCLYAEDGIDLGDADPYDIGLDYRLADPRRKLVKRYVNASLNDESGRFGLKAAELRVLGLTDEELKQRVASRHKPIERHFHSGVGLRLQFIDSQIAMAVLKRLADEGEVCLPVHDSFIVRSGLTDHLQQIMQEEFYDQTGVSARITADEVIEGRRFALPAFEGPDAIPVSGIVNALNAHFSQFSIAQQFLANWFEFERDCLGVGQPDISLFSAAQKSALIKRGSVTVA